MSQNVCSFCGNYHQPERACPAAQQKGSPPPEVSHYEYREGRGYLKPVMQPGDAGQPERERFIAVHEITCELESLAEGKNYPCPELHVSKPLGKALVAYTEMVQLAALERLRELEAKWRSPDWARAYMSDDRPSEFICADELHAVLDELKPSDAKQPSLESTKVIVKCSQCGKLTDETFYCSDGVNEAIRVCSNCRGER